VPLLAAGLIVARCGSPTNEEADVWIDVGLVLRVLVALVTATVMAVISWWKQVD
jgi:hypothetical protein